MKGFRPLLKKTSLNKKVNGSLDLSRVQLIWLLSLRIDEPLVGLV